MKKGQHRPRVVLIFYLVIIFLTGCVQQEADYRITLKKISSFETTVFGQSAVEIIGYDPGSRRLFMVNGYQRSVWVLDIGIPARPTKIHEIKTQRSNQVINSVAVKNGLVAVAVENRDPEDYSTHPIQLRGTVDIYRADAKAFSSPLASIQVGFMPDCVTFSEDGKYIITANEGEPNTYYTVDPVGSISIIDISNGPLNGVHKEATFNLFTKEPLQNAGIHIYGRKNKKPTNQDMLALMKTKAGLHKELKPGKNSTVSEDLEPEYVVEHDGKAYVTLQENNGVAIVDLRSATVTNMIGLGEKDHQQPGNEFDASDRDDAINIRNWPVYGRFQPDGIEILTVDEKVYFITANEGDARNYINRWVENGKMKKVTFFSEEKRVKNIKLAGKLKQIQDLQDDKNLGRLKISKILGANTNGEIEKLYSFGGRSFSIWEADNYKRIDTARLVYDSGNDFEQITAARLNKTGFNSTSSKQIFDNRSDDRGPEPEALTVGKIAGRTYIFIGLERVGGIMIYDITDPKHVTFIDYILDRDFSEQPGNTDETHNIPVGDLGPESLIFIDESESPIGKPMLLAGNEISGNISIYKIIRIRQ